MGRKIIGLVIGMVFLSIGVYLFENGWKIYRQGQTTKEWSTIGGVIGSCDIALNKHGSKDDTPYEVYVKYDYQVGDRAFEGGCIYHRAMASFATREKAEAFAAQYPAGAPVTVYYDSRNPEDALLRPGSTAEGPFLMFFGGFLGLISIFNIFTKR